MSERLNDEEKASFRAYAEDCQTDEDGSECQWAGYTIRLLDEVAAERAAHEETRRRLAEAREEIECDGGPKLARIRELEAALRENDENVAEIESALQAAERKAAQLASILGCSPGEVVERVRREKDLLDRIARSPYSFLYGNEGLRDAAGPAGKTEAEQTGVRVHLTMDTVLRMRHRHDAALAPSRPASEPASCKNCGQPSNREFCRSCMPDPTAASEPAGHYGAVKIETRPLFSPCPFCGIPHSKGRPCKPAPEPAASGGDQGRLKAWVDGELKLIDAVADRKRRAAEEPAQPGEGGSDGR